MPLTIKDHIEAGHYERDERGRALVPMENGETATILVTDCPDGWCLWGFRSGAWPKRPLAWNEDGRLDANWTPCHEHLLPPPTRKVKVTTWAVMVKGRPTPWTSKDSEAEAREAGRRYLGSDWTVVPLTGEYEEEWPA